jgi:hypothetical protein
MRIISYKAVKIDGRVQAYKVYFNRWKRKIPFAKLPIDIIYACKLMVDQCGGRVW